VTHLVLRLLETAINVISETKDGTIYYRMRLNLLSSASDTVQYLHVAAPYLECHISHVDGGPDSISQDARVSSVAIGCK